MSTNIQRFAQTNSILKKYRNVCIYCKEEARFRMICYDCMQTKDIMEIIIIDNIKIYNKILKRNI